MFIVSLAIADLIVGLVVMPISTVYIFTDEWLFGTAVCQIWIGIDYTASTASILNLFILSLDRYWSVTSPLKYLRKRTKKRAVLMITGVWCLSSMWIVHIIGWQHFFFGGKRSVPSSMCDTEYAKKYLLTTKNVERYFYEEFSSIKPQQEPPHALIMMNSNNTSADLSTPSTPKSSSSSTED
ncbi:HRH1-like protein [Mya arenaria]|uniref:HRH1-like protein n=1 Tax=Mya arenaria TaxID=6604 RepID=A0ABY7FTK1_MYAAR|nr:HRH1-like protein [Mya arenaria]